MRVRLVVAYDGTDFAGWQVQPGQRTVQGVLERALARLTKAEERVVVAGAGRTDAGVHAEAMVAAFDSPRPLPLVAFVRGQQCVEPPDVAIRSAAVVASSFDPRRHARGKRYRYRILNQPLRSPLHRRRWWHVREPLDVDAMRAAAAHLVGEHDFSAFRAQGCEAKATVRRLFRLDVEGAPPEIEIVAEATAFLRYMVRNIVGTLVDVGRGALAPGAMPDLLSSGDRSRAGRTAPAHGLTLEAVYYEGGPELVGASE